jgi:hypothetical protein
MDVLGALCLLHYDEPESRKVFQQLIWCQLAVTQLKHMKSVQLTTVCLSPEPKHFLGLSVFKK